MKKKLIYILLVLLPFIDLITSLQTRLNPSGMSIGMLIKGLLAFLAVIYIFFFSVSKYKKKSIFNIFIILLFVVCYFAFKPDLLQFPYLVTELKFLLRILFMPILFLFFLNYFDEFGFDKKTFERCTALVLIEFVILLLIPLLLDLAFESYSTGLHGYVGWFYAANEISVIMIILLPFVYSLLNKKYNFFVALPILYAIACIGTKVTLIGSICVVSLGLIFNLIQYKGKLNTYTIGSIMMVVFTIFFFGFSQNLAIDNMVTLAQRQDFTFVKTPEKDKNDANLDSEKEENDENPLNTSALLKYLLSSRDIYFVQTKDIYNTTYEVSYPFVGMGFSNTERINNINIDKLIEIDYLDLYYHTGLFGLLIVLIPYIYVGISVIKILFKGSLTREKICFLFFNSLIVCMALGVALIAGHVLFYPAVSIYLALYLMYLLAACDKFTKKEINDKKINILALHLNYGGVENVLTNQANMLSDEYEVEIISLYKSSDKVPFKINKNVKVTYLMDTISNRQEFVSALKRFRIFKIIKEGYKAIRVLYLKPRLIKKAILESDAKVIVSTRKEFSKLLGKYQRRGIISIGEEHNHHKNNDKIIKQVVRFNKNMDYLLPTSEELCNFYSSRVKAKVKYISNSLNYYPEKVNLLNTKKIIAVGRLSKEKGFIDLIPVMKEIVKKDSEVVLDIYGDGAEKESILSLIKEENLENNITLKGFLEPDKLRKVMPEYSLIVCPSYEESFGLAVLEAMSFGIPCVMYDDAKGPLEFVNSETGIVIENRDAAQMAKAIIKLFNDKDRLKLLGKNSRNISKKYSFEDVQIQLLDLIEEALEYSKYKGKNIMFISSSGGHLNEMMQLNTLFAKYDYSLITEKTKTTKGLKDKHIGRCGYLLFGTKHHPISYFLWVLPANCFISSFFYLKYRPKFIVTTGAHTAGPMCMIGKLFGSKIIFIESFANIHSKSVTGRIIYHFADLFVVQWKEMLEVYPNSTYGGWIY